VLKQVNHGASFQSVAVAVIVREWPSGSIENMSRDSSTLLVSIKVFAVLHRTNSPWRACANFRPLCFVPQSRLFGVRTRPRVALMPAGGARHSAQFLPKQQLSP